MTPEEEASLAEWLGKAQADPEPTEDQIIGWNEANDYWSEANDCKPDREAGE